MRKRRLGVSSLLIAAIINCTPLSNVISADSKNIAIPAKSTSSSVKAVDTNSTNKVLISKERAIDIFKGKCKLLFGIDLNNMNSSINAQLNENNGWRGSIWNISINNLNARKDISASINARNGNIITFSNLTFPFDSSSQKIVVPLITLQEAKKVSDDFLNKINPQIAKNVKESPQYLGKPSGTAYCLYYRRMYNGVPVDDDGVNITVDSSSGKVTFYNNIWHDNVSIKPSKAIGADISALETYKKLINLKLCYKSINGKLILAYLPDSYSNIYVNTDGKTFMDSYGKSTTTISNKSKDISASEKSEIYKSAQANKSKISNLNSAKEYALDFIKKYFKDNYLVSEAESTSSNYNNEGYFPCWYFNFSNIKNPSTFISVEMRQDNHQIYSLSIFDRNGNSATSSKNTIKSVLKWSDAYSKAISIIKDLYPQYINDIETKQNENINNMYSGNSPMYSFNFHRMYKGISYDTDKITIYIDSITGEPSINLAWTKNAVFPSFVPAITSAKAKKIYFNKFEPKLKYIFLQNNSSDNINNSHDKDGSLNTAEVYALNCKLNNNVYGSSPIDCVNATNGVLYDYLGSAIADNKNLSPEVIKNSIAKKQLQMFLDTGLLTGKNFSLNSPITRKDALTLIIQAKELNGYLNDSGSNNITTVSYTDISKNDDFYPYVSAAIKDGMIEDKKTKFLPNEPLTKLDMASWLINGMSSDDLAKVSDILNINISKQNESTNNYKGYIAIFNGLHFNLKPEKFASNDKVTWEELIYGLYNAMKYLKPINTGNL